MRTAKGHWTLFLALTAVETSLVVLWLQNGLLWAKALYLSFNWTVHVALIVAIFLSHILVALLGVERPPREVFHRSWALVQCKRLAALTHLCLMLYIGQVALAVTIIAAHVIARLDRKFQKA